MGTEPRISWEIDEVYLPAVGRLPWGEPIGRWRRLGVRQLHVRRGQGRHPVVFVKAGPWKLVIKELGLDGARREVASYRRLLALGIRTLTPVGWVAREEAPLVAASPVGLLTERDVVGHTLTLLARRVLPESRLLSLALEPGQRRRIADAVVDLFVDLHSRGVYWGDASLDNLLIQFVQVRIPQIGRRTRLRALLADAETVEVHPALSAGLRRADLDHFIESIEWFAEDLRARGDLAGPVATAADRDYLLEAYGRRLAVAMEAPAFEAATGLELAADLGEVEHPTYLKDLRQHIGEHRWYLGERQGEPVTLPLAARDWLANVFLPVCELFRQAGVVDLFPAKTAAELYVEVMTHKYFLSRAEGRDVGLPAAVKDYGERFGDQPPLAAFWRRVLRGLRGLSGDAGEGIS